MVLQCFEVHYIHLEEVVKTGEFSGKSSLTIYFDFKYSTPLFLLENLNYNSNDNDEK